jgi:hypothetical protein
VFWLRDTKQAVIEFDDEWYIQGDDYIVDSIAEIVGVKGSVITATNLRAGNMFDPSSFAYADPVMSRSFTNCMWSDFTCDYMILCADLHYPTD